MNCSVACCLPLLPGEVALRCNDGEVYSSRILDTRIAKTISPTQGTMLVAIPTARPALSATLPMTQGIRIAPLDATGSMMPMLVTVVILPALATAVGFIPAMEKAKANSSRMAGSWLWVCIMAK